MITFNFQAGFEKSLVSTAMRLRIFVEMVSNLRRNFLLHMETYKIFKEFEENATSFVKFLRKLTLDSHTILVQKLESNIQQVCFHTSDTSPSNRERHSSVMSQSKTISETLRLFWSHVENSQVLSALHCNHIRPPSIANERQPSVGRKSGS